MDNNGDLALKELIIAVRNGDESAFEKLVDMYKPMMDSLIRSFSFDARDAFSEACMSFYRAVSSYDLEQDGVTFGLYAKICVERCLIDLHKREGRDVTHYVDNDVDVDRIAVCDGVQAMLEHREQTAYFLSVAKDTLSDFEYEVYRYWMLGDKTSDIASILEVTAKAVDNAKNRMWTKLRERLSPEV